MGERTTALIRVWNTKDGQKVEEFSTIIYYQWGFGRAMLMDLLNLAVQGYPEPRKDRFKAVEFKDGYEQDWIGWIDDKTEGRLMFDPEDNQDNLEVFHITDDEFINTAEEDGGAILDFFCNGYHVANELSLFQWQETKDDQWKFEPSSFDDYCTGSDDNYYTTEKWRNAYLQMLKEYEIRLIEP